ncbi:MAG: hypothetical protein JRJ38_03000 [Deltaproteobacteria bacterium]|nr:hypothetical protein [Deltaproteobacteria bacterium]
MKKTIIIFIVTTIAFFVSGNQPNYAAEPQMVYYESYPLFMVDSVEPNILIMLDNSGSMNFNAYGTYPGDGGTVTAPFSGEPYSGRLDIRVCQSSDDAEERHTIVDNSWNNSTDLDLGGFGDATNDALLAIRFQNLGIPKGATINSAYIKFEAYADSSTLPANTSFTIVGEASDNADQFSNGQDEISNRPDTTAPVAVAWNNVDAWTADDTYETPDLSAIVQEIVNRPGWSSGNAMVFKISGTGKRDAKAYDDEGYHHGPLLHVEYSPAESVTYYGYFNPDYFYYWNVNKFDHKYKKVQYVGDPSSGHWSVEDLSGNPHNLLDSEIATGDPNTGLWDGNWLNWLCMRRIDVLRKVLMGGLATSRTGGGNQVNYGETPAQSSRTFIRRFNTSTASAVSPYDGDYYYGMKGGYIYVDNDSSPFSSEIDKFDIKVQKNVNYEPEDFYHYDNGDNLAGVLQKVGDDARWGNEFFYEGTGNNREGGYIDHPIGSNMTSLVTDLQNTGCDTWTPLAESYYVAMQYFKQEDPDTGLGYSNNAIGATNNVNDPYHNGTEFVYCAKSFVILLTDGASTKDEKIPAYLKDYDGDGNDPGTYDSDGTDYLDDIALYARTTDLRSSTVGKSELDGDQNLILYTIYAFGDDDNARQLLKDAARNGGFIDRDGDNRPDGDYDDPPEDRLEWDEDGDGNPDTYFEATDGAKLEEELLKAITDILRRAASGTAVSVLSTSSEGEGNLVQAYFKPVVSTGTEEAKWVGYFQSLWLDEKGNLREDTNPRDQALDINHDRIIRYVNVSGETKIELYDVSADPYPDLETTSPVGTVAMEQISPLWEAGKLLAQRDSNERKIFTFIDTQDGIVDALADGDPSTDDDPFDSSGELVKFDTGAASAIKPYLGVGDDTEWAYLGDTHDNRVTNLIHFIRGNDSGFSGDTTNLSIRTRNVDNSVWKLGDIVHSTPMAVCEPLDNYDILYADESYQTYFDAVKNREKVIYVGANDGMLHAFTSWEYDKTNKKYVKPAGTTEDIGDEIWAYIPQCLLPHLKWLPSNGYTHVYYVDFKPKIFDAKILPDGAHYTDTDGEANWGTFLLVGMNNGGKHIWAEGDYNDGLGIRTRHFYPTYVCMDITEPRNPRLLWERTYSVPAAPAENASNDTDQGLTTFTPAIVKVKEKWFAVFGSGPIDFDGNSDRNGHIFVVDLRTGEPYRNGTDDWLFETPDPRAFMASPVSMDKNMNYNVDAIYIGETYDDDNGVGFDWKGAMYKVTVPWDFSQLSTYKDNPDQWTLSKLFDSPAPITAPAALSVDSLDNAWIYFGTGRYLSEDDKSNTDQQYFFGIKDPFFNKEHTIGGSFNDTYYHKNGLLLDISHLFEADLYTVVEGGAVYTGGSFYGNFNYLKSQARLKDGWYRTLSQETKERCIVKPAIVGGTVLAPTFAPNDDICEFGGNSYLYGLYYETGTAYARAVFTGGTDTVQTDDGPKEKVLDVIDLGEGMASSSGIHIGRQEGGKAGAFIQISTGEVVGLEIDPALKPRSGLKFWIEK